MLFYMVFLSFVWHAVHHELGGLSGHLLHYSHSRKAPCAFHFSCVLLYFHIKHFSNFFLLQTKTKVFHEDKSILHAPFLLQNFWQGLHSRISAVE